MNNMKLWRMSVGAPEKELCLADGIPGIAGNAWIWYFTDYPVWFWAGAAVCKQHNLSYICQQTEKLKSVFSR